MERQRAEVTIQELPGGPEVAIEYEDGHTVRLKVQADSIVLRMHLGLDEEKVTSIAKDAELA